MGSYNFGSEEELIRSITVDNKGKVRIGKDIIGVAKKGGQGLKGERGDVGAVPKHEWDETKIRFENPDKTWGPWVDLKGLAGRNGEDGTPGIDGVDGTDGINGEPGKDGLPGKDGTPGQDGKDGRDGKAGKPGQEGEPGKDGKDGDKGEIPKHEWDGTEIRFQNPDGSWGDFVDLKGLDGQDGKDGRPGQEGKSLQGYPGIQGDKGEPGIPPHDWNITLNNVALLLKRQQDIIFELKQMGVEI